MKISVRARPQPAAILDSLTTAVIALDPALRVSYLNSACEILLGLSRHHAIGLPLTQGVPHLAEHEARLRQAADSGTGFIERELKLRRNGEELLTVDCTVTPLGTPSGLLLEILPLDQYLRISRDELLARQHEASRELIRGLAHEVKNPLGGIRGAAQLLEREYPDSAHREYTQVIIREADRLQNLVDRMLGPNRLPQRAPVNVHEVVEHVRNLLEAEAAGRGVAVRRDYDPSIPDLLADREQLIQATLNLARNALQALAAGSHGDACILLRTRMRRQLTLRGRRHRLAVQIDVEDNGPGIPPALMEKIFYPMVTTRAEGGGLGLPIAQHLIHAHGGQIECSSQPGRTVFSVFLPLHPPE
ncbi:MAG: nitrogen regulation protein NR(II) [Nevskia sp.]|nr:nitrogen regulation protein NR(II) [Nevskia sp.]